VSAERDQEAVRRARAREVGLFRYGLIQDALDPALSTKQRGRLVRALAEREHEGPFGAPVRVSRASLDRWIRDWRRGGFDALVPEPRRVGPRTPAEVLDLAVALKKEVPQRTAAARPRWRSPPNRQRPAHRGSGTSRHPRTRRAAAPSAAG
jgi:putative transposase